MRNAVARLSRFLLALLLLAGCGSQPAVLTSLLPKPGAFPNWSLQGEARVYNRDNLFDMVDGQADGFFVYGFEQVATQRYQDASGSVLEVAVWQLATPADAYGLFTAGRAGQPATVCPSTLPSVAGQASSKGAGQCYEGDADAGRRLAFWQDRYYVQVYGRQPVPDADLQAFAGAVSAGLPAGAERPALVRRLPEDNLIERGFIFFHEEISIQTEIWLGGQNMLGLSPQTDGVMARYDVGGAPANLLLIEYPDALAASVGLAALQGGQVDGLLAAEARDKLLGAVFGQVDPAAADDLLSKALGNQP